MKSLAMMMQKFLQGQQIQGNPLNQVTTYINARMNNMFNDLSTKYDNVARHLYCWGKTLRYWIPPDPRQDTSLWISAGRNPGSQDPWQKEPRFPRSLAEGTPIPRYGVLPGLVQNRTLPSGNGKLPIRRTFHMNMEELNLLRPTKARLRKTI